MRSAGFELLWVRQDPFEVQIDADGAEMKLVAVAEGELSAWGAPI